MSIANDKKINKVTKYEYFVAEKEANGEQIAIKTISEYGKEQMQKKNN